MAKPLVVALVVFPIESSLGSISSARPFIPESSAMPWALSAMGPNESIDTISPVVVNIPMPASTTPYAAIKGSLNKRKLARIVTPIARTAHTLEEKPNRTKLLWQDRFETVLKYLSPEHGRRLRTRLKEI